MTLKLCWLLALLWRRVFGQKAVSFGHALRKDFFFDANFTQFNHGSSGAVPRYVMAALQRYQVLRETSYNSEAVLEAAVDAARIAVAQMINASPDDVVLVENASGAINGILNFLRSGDVIVDLSSAYAPFAAFYSWLSATRGVRVVTGQLQWPLSGDEEVVAAFESALAKGGTRVKIAIVSHISAHPALVLPVKKLVPIARKHGVPIIVDGAHALGQIKVDMDELGDPDFYFTNAHKWLFGAKGSAALYVRRSRQGQYWPQPNTVNSVNNTFQERYANTGTRDNSPYAAVLDAIAYRRDFLGGELAIRTYIHNLALWGQRYLVKRWGTWALGPEHSLAAMSNVAIPTKTNSTSECLAATCGLLRWGILVNVETPIEGQWGCIVRLSAQVYLEQSDYKLVGEYVLKLLEDYHSQKDAQVGQSLPVTDKTWGSVRLRNPCANWPPARPAKMTSNSLKENHLYL